MLPFINVLGRQIPTYGIFMLLGFIASFVVFIIRCHVYRVKTYTFVNLAFIVIAGGIAGAFLIKPIIKLPEILFNIDNYMHMTLESFLHYWFGEIVYYGGFIGGIIAGILFCRSFRIPFLSTADLFAPSIALGHGIGRLGCLLAGCCYGIEVNASNPFAIVYPPNSIPGAAPDGVPLLAVPLIEFFVNISIFIIIIFAEKYKKHDGINIFLYSTLYSIARFVLEFFRGDIIRGKIGMLATSQIISIIIFLLSLSLLFYIKFSRRINKINK